MFNFKDFLKLFKFKKKKAKKSWKVKYQDELEDFDKKVNGKFTYLGVKFKIIRHYVALPRIGILPRLVCNYKDKHGNVKTEEFDLQEFESIKKHGKFKKNGKNKRMG